MTTSAPTITQEAIKAAQDALADKDKRIKYLEDTVAKATGELADANKSVSEMKEAIKNLQTEMKDIEDFKNIDIKSILESVELTKSGVDAIKARMRRGYGPAALPELANGDLNMIGMIACAKRGNVVKGWEKEWEALKSYNDNARTKGMITVDDEGGFFIPEQVLADVIAPFYRDSAFIALDGQGETRASVVQGLIGESVRIPKVESGAIAYHMGTEAARHIPSRMKAGSVRMTRRKAGVATVFTKEMVQHPQAQGFLQMTRRDMTRALVQLVDYSVCYGAGSDNEPRGLFNTPGIRRFYATDQQVYAYGSAPGSITGGLFDFSSMTRIDNALKRSNVPMDASFATLSSPELFSKLKLLRYLMFSGQDPRSAPFLSMIPLSDQRLAEIIRAYGESTLFPANKTIGSDAYYTDVVRGNLAELVIGIWSGMAVESSDQAGDLWWNDEEAVKMTFHYDCVVRHTESLILCEDANADLDAVTYNHEE